MTDIYRTPNKTTLNAFILPSQHRPGTDLVSKLILRHPSVRNIIVNAVLGSEVCSQYADRSTEWPSGRCSDVLFASIEVTISLPPVLVEVQNTIDLKLIQRVTEYCLAINKEHGTLSIVVVFGIHPTKSSIVNDLVQSNQILYAKEYPCKSWAKYFTFCILSLSAIIAKQIFENDVTLEKRTIDVFLNVCEQTQKQFYKIKEALEIENLEELRKLTREYTEDGYMYLETCKTKNRHTSLPELLNLSEEAKKR
ncbi:hypothetical protein CU097_015470 [Rhizopus azygosporus]|uniref:Uncharacterized protein n=1 Tax=Rhizopus azygosporus TaxID=86630 RepID=A0A367KEQ2_RHIAZ|nr:hypothetical protein CU097_015470 [Rhizopus azygosporus]